MEWCVKKYIGENMQIFCMSSIKCQTVFKNKGKGFLVPRNGGTLEEKLENVQGGLEVFYKVHGCFLGIQVKFKFRIV